MTVTMPQPVWHCVQTVAVGQTVTVVGWMAMLVQPQSNVTAANDTRKPVSLRSSTWAKPRCLLKDQEAGDTYRQQSTAR